MKPRGPLRVVDLDVHVTGRKLLSGVSFELAAGDALWIVGPSGSGKSTLLRALIGFSTEPSAGEVTLGDATLATEGYARWRRSVSYAPPDARLVGASVRAILERPFSYAQASTNFDAKAAADHLEALGLPGTLHRDPRDLSSGEKQRVALLRALLHGPAVSLLDEPFTHLDDASFAQALRWLNTWQERGTALLVVSHRALPFAKLDVARFAVTGDDA